MNGKPNIDGNKLHTLMSEARRNGVGGVMLNVSDAPQPRLQFTLYQNGTAQIYAERGMHPDTCKVMLLQAVLSVTLGIQIVLPETEFAPNPEPNKFG